MYKTNGIKDEISDFVICLIFILPAILVETGIYISKRIVNITSEVT